MGTRGAVGGAATLSGKEAVGGGTHFGLLVTPIFPSLAPRQINTAVHMDNIATSVLSD